MMTMMMMMKTVYTVYMMSVANKPITTRYTLHEFGLLSDDDTSANHQHYQIHTCTHTFALYTRDEHTRPPYRRSPRPERARCTRDTKTTDYDRAVIVNLVYCNARDAVVTDTPASIKSNGHSAPSTGRTTSSCCLLVTDDEVVFASTGRTVEHWW